MLGILGHRLLSANKRLANENLWNPAPPQLVSRDKADKVSAVGLLQSKISFPLTIPMNWLQLFILPHKPTITRRCIRNWALRRSATSAIVPHSELSFRPFSGMLFVLIPIPNKARSTIWNMDAALWLALILALSEVKCCYSYVLVDFLVLGVWEICCTGSTLLINFLYLFICL